MIPWPRWFARKPDLPPEIAPLLEQWQKTAAPKLGTDCNDISWVVADVETSGLDVRRDRLISMGAVRIAQGGLMLDSTLEIVVQQATPSTPGNILIHGIGAAEQAGGMPSVEALARFLAYAGHSPLVGFHVEFDVAILKRAMQEQLGIHYNPPALDLARLAPALFPALAGSVSSLDQWLHHFGVAVYDRHDALADAYCSAQLFLILLGQAREQRYMTGKQLLQLSSAQKWLEHSLR